MGILHVAKYGFEAKNNQIDEETTLNCIRLVDYFSNHAQVAFNIMGSDDKTEKAKKIISWMVDKNIKQINARDIQQALRRTFRYKRELNPILDLLKENHYLFITMQESSNTRRKPSPTYKLHPFTGSGEYRLIFNKLITRLLSLV